SDCMIKAISLICSLKGSKQESSAELLSSQVLEEIKKLGADTKSFRIADYNIAPGIGQDMGDGDEWPKIRKAVLKADILLIATPIWMGHPSSICQRVLERLNAD